MQPSSHFEGALRRGSHQRRPSPWAAHCRRHRYRALTAEHPRRPAPRRDAVALLQTSDHPLQTLRATLYQPLTAPVSLASQDRRQRQPVLRVHRQWSAQRRCQQPRSSRSPYPSAALTPRWRSRQILQRTAASGSSGRCRRTLRPSMQQHPVPQHIASIQSTALDHDDRPARRSGGNTAGVLRRRRVVAAFCTCRRRIRRVLTRCP